MVSLEKIGREFLDLSSDLICFCREGIIIFINESGRHLLGSESTAQLEGRAFSQFVHPDFHPVIAQGLEEIAQEHRPTPLKLIRRDGHVISAELTVNPLEDGFLLKARDVTELTKATVRLLNSEKRYRQLLELKIDMVCAAVADEITYINPAGARMMGAKNPAELIGSPFSRLVHPDYREVITEGLAELAQEGTSMPLKFVKLDGSAFDVEMSTSALGKKPEHGYMVEARDVSERNRAAEALREREQKLQGIMDSVADAIVTADQKGIIQSFNPAAQRIFGYKANEVLGRNLNMLMPDEHAQRHDGYLARYLKEGTPRMLGSTREMEARCKDGSLFPIDLNVTELRRGRERLFIGIIRDITERKKAEEKIRYQANYDPLTGLANRNLFLEKLDLAVSRSLEGEKGRLFFIGLEGFKLVNDIHGHVVADRLLQEVALRLAKLVREEDLVARLEGSEFAILIANGMEFTNKAEDFARNLVATLEKPFDLEGFEAIISATIGITTFPDDGKSSRILLKNADAAMVAAHDKGGIEFYNESLNVASEERLLIKNSLFKALERGEFEVVYQPKMAVRSNRICGAEALLRWKSKDLGSVSPARFVPILEETSLIMPIGEWVFETVCKQYKTWAEMGFANIRLAANLSVKQLRPGLPRIIENILERTGIPPHGVELEITESSIMKDAEQAIKLLGELSQIGIHLTMDDFGTGYSSFAYLKKLPLGTIKIDRSFIIDITKDPKDGEIVRAIIDMGHALNRHVVAEGIENADQLAIMRRYHCDEIQGYFISPPLSADKFTTLLQEQRPKA